MPWVSSSFPFARGRKRLAWAGAGPDGTGVRPGGEPQGVGPAAGAGEEMTLAIASEVIRRDLLNGPGINVSGREKSGGDEVSQPLDAVGVNLIKVSSPGGHLIFCSMRSRSRTSWRPISTAVAQKPAESLAT